MIGKRVRFYLITSLIIFSFITLGLLMDNSVVSDDNKMKSSIADPKEPHRINSGGTIDIAEGNFSGSGNSLSAQSFGQIQGIQGGLITNTSFTVEIADWNGTGIQINVSKMQINMTLLGELNFLETRLLNLGPPSGFPVYAQAIRVPSIAYLVDVAAYLRIKSLSPGQDLSVEVWNAIDSGGLKPNLKVSAINYNIGTGDPADYDAWVKVVFPTPILLNGLLTAGNTFFILLYRSGGSTVIEWIGANDSLEINECDVWQNDGTSWKSYGFDFSLNATIRATPRPSEVYLKINGTYVADQAAGNGTYSLSFPSSLKGPLFFMITAISKVKMDLKWLLNISQIQAFDTNFLIKRDWAFSKWNATQTVNFLMNTANRGINVSIPRWNIERIKHNGVLYSNWVVTQYLSYQKITILNPNNGTWTVECNSTNYIKEVLVSKGANSTNTVNVTDTVNIKAQLKAKLTTGNANLTIFPIAMAKHNDSAILQGNNSIQFEPWTIIDTAIANPGIFTLQVMWYNGTEVGLNATSLNVLSINTTLTYLRHTASVTTGASIYASVNFSNSFNKAPISGASLLVRNSTNKALWPASFQIIRDYLNGTYDIEILTLGLDAGVYSFSIDLSKPLYCSSEVSGLSVTIGGGGISNISVTAPDCMGLLKLNGSYAVVNPAPYHNATIKVKVYYFNALTMQPLSGGVVSASWIGGGPESAWVPTQFGYYEITIDVTGFHAGTNHTLRISLQQVGYTTAVLYVIAPIKKIPTVIQPLQTVFGAHIEETIPIFAVFKNIIEDESIPSVYDLHGNFTIRINAFNQNMTRLLPQVGLYYYNLILSQLQLEQGKSYNITILAYSSEHELAITNISLYIIPNSPAYLVLLSLPPYFLAGTEFKIYAQITTSNGTPLYNIPLIYKRIFYPGSLIIQTTEITNGTGFCELRVDALAEMQSVMIKLEYLGNSTVQNGTISSAIIPIIKLNSSITLSNLPAEIQEGDALRLNATLVINGLPAAGKIIKFTFSYEGSDEIDILSAGTNEEGVAPVVFVVPEGVTRLYVTASFDGLSYINASNSAGDVSVISFTTLVWRYAPIWLSITLAVVGGALTYKYGYKRTKIIRLKSKWGATAQKFQNTLNVNFLMIILKNSGLSLYNYSFKGEKVDYELMSGFLSAISMFKRELITTGKKEIVKQPEWEMSYQEFKIYGIDREYVQFIFILEESPSATLKKIISEFIVDTEDKFQEMFATFRGDTTEFKEIDSLIKYHFETSLVLPHYTVNLSNDQLKQLSDLERQIYNLAQMFMKQQGYFYIPNLLNNISEMSKKEKNQILHEIYGLIKKNYFTASRMSLLLD